MKNYFKIIYCFLIITAFMATSTFVYSKEQTSRQNVLISLAYPQGANVPKRQSTKIDKPAVLEGEVAINIMAAKPAQLKSYAIKNSAVYVEYYLDNELIYTTKDSAPESKSRSAGFGFILDTRAHPDGEHTLTANLWDKDGPSAIGIRKIIIRNETKDAS